MTAIAASLARCLEVALGSARFAAAAPLPVQACSPVPTLCWCGATCWPAWCAAARAGSATGPADHSGAAPPAPAESDALPPGAAVFVPGRGLHYGGNRVAAAARPDAAPSALPSSAMDLPGVQAQHYGGNRVAAAARPDAAPSVLPSPPVGRLGEPAVALWNRFAPLTTEEGEAAERHHGGSRMADAARTEAAPCSGIAKASAPHYGGNRAAGAAWPAARPDAAPSREAQRRRSRHYLSRSGGSSATSEEHGSGHHVSSATRGAARGAARSRPPRDGQASHRAVGCEQRAAAQCFGGLRRGFLVAPSAHGTGRGAAAVEALEVRSCEETCATSRIVTAAEEEPPAAAADSPEDDAASAVEEEEAPVAAAPP